MVTTGDRSYDLVVDYTALALPEGFDRLIAETWSLVDDLPELTQSDGVRLLALLAADAELPFQMQALAHYVEALAPGMWCSIMLVDSEGTTLVGVAAPSLPAAWRERVATVQVAEGQGSCGTAAARGEVVIVPDVRMSPLWDGHAGAAVEAGLCACWSVPFSDLHGRLLGTLALYYGEPRTPSDHERRLIDLAARLAALVTLRHRNAADLRLSQRRSRELIDLCSNALFVRRGNRWVYLNAPAQRLLGLTLPNNVTDLPLESIVVAQDLRALRAFTAGEATFTLRHQEGHAVPMRVCAVSGSGSHQETVVLTGIALRVFAELEHAALDAADERCSRLATDLSNSACQQLAGIDYLIEAVASGAEPRWAKPLRDAQRLLQDTRREIALLASWIAPAPLGAMTLAEGLERLAQEVQARVGRRLVCDIPDDLLDPLSRLDASQLLPLLARLIRAGAEHPASADVTLRARGDVDQVRVSVTVDGPCFAPDPGLAVFGDAQHRAWRFGSILRFDSLESGAKSRAILHLLARS
jgi:GAF domain-containing protein